MDTMDLCEEPLSRSSKEASATICPHNAGAHVCEHCLRRDACVQDRLSKGGCREICQMMCVKKAGQTALWKGLARLRAMTRSVNLPRESSPHFAPLWLATCPSSAFTWRGKSFRVWQAHLVELRRSAPKNYVIKKTGMKKTAFVTKTGHRPCEDPAGLTPINETGLRFLWLDIFSFCTSVACTILLYIYQKGPS